MGALLTTCPATGQPIETGIESDALSMERTPQFRANIPCSYCQTTHTFSKQDFFVCEMVDGVIRYMRAA